MEKRCYFERFERVSINNFVVAGPLVPPQRVLVILEPIAELGGTNRLQSTSGLQNVEGLSNQIVQIVRNMWHLGEMQCTLCVFFFVGNSVNVQGGIYHVLHQMYKGKCHNCV